MKAIRIPIIVVTALVTILAEIGHAQAIDIAPMTWTPRSDWINIKTDVTPAAVGDGVADDTAAIQAALSIVGTNRKYTVYLPAGVYKITAPLTWSNVTGGTIIGCGSNTTIEWWGTAGGTMFSSEGATLSRYIGISWNGRNLAQYGVHHQSTTLYETRVRHENEAFRNFTGVGIMSGADTTKSPIAEAIIWNNLFENCATGAVVGQLSYNVASWVFEACEFQNCGTGISFPKGQGFVYDSHFQGSTVADISSGAVPLRIRRCTSVGSKVFFTTSTTDVVNSQILADCHVDSWTNTTGVLLMAALGPYQVFDCVFTNPPNAALPINLRTRATSPGARLITSGNYSPGLSNLVNATQNVNNVVQDVPCGSIAGNTITADTSFLETVWPSDGPVIDISQAPYSADKNGSGDSTVAFQNAINAARTANNGSIVYIPAGNYKVTNTLSVTGSNYRIQGSGWRSLLKWSGTSAGPIFAVNSPSTIAMEQLRTDGTSVTSVLQTGTSAGDMVYDGFYAPQMAPGVELRNLPAGARVYLKHLDSALTVNDCGAAEILANLQYNGCLNVKGATNPKTGFLGVMFFDGGFQSSRSTDPTVWAATIDDNQDLAIGDAYQEQESNHYMLKRGARTGTGRFSAQGIKQHSNSNTPPFVQLSVDNYQGRIFWAGENFANNSTTDTFNHTGANACDLILSSMTHRVGSTTTLGTGARLIRTQCVYNSTSATPTYAPESMPTGAMESMASGYDHLRQLSAEALKLRYGIYNWLINPTLELDTVNASPLTALGTAPVSWRVSNAVVTGSGVKSISVASGGSPFGPGTKSIAAVDTTMSSTASVQFDQYISTMNTAEPAVFAFDFKINSLPAGNATKFYAFTYADGQPSVCTVRLSASGTAGSLVSPSNGVETTRCALQLDTWYRLEVAIPPVANGPASSTLYLTKWGESTPQVFTMDGVTASITKGIRRLLFTSADSNRNTYINIDNIRLQNGDPLTQP